MKIKLIVHHCELAYKVKETGKPVYRLYFEIGDYEYAWVRSFTPYAAGTEVLVVAEKLITNDFNNGRLTFKVA